MHFQEKTIKLIRTLNLYLIFLGLGMTVAVPGPTLLELQTMLNTDTGHITFIYIPRSIGVLIGSAVGGVLLDKFYMYKEIVVILSTVWMGVSIAVVPWWNSLFAVCINILINGLAIGCLDTGGNVCCLEIWSKQSGVYLQILHFCFGFGAFIAPLIAEPFLSIHVNTHDSNSTTSNSSSVFSSEITTVMNTTNEAVGFPIRFAYGIISGYLIIISLWSAFTFFILPRRKPSDTHQDKKNSRNTNFALFITIVLLITVLMCITVGIEIGFGQLIATFAVRSNLQLSESVGSYMTSLYWGTYTFARIFSIFLVNCTSLIFPILFDFVMITLASICLSLFGNSIVEVLWAGIAVFGFGMSSIFPSVLAWFEHHIPFNSKVASMFVVGGALGELILPLSVGHFIDNYPVSMMYATLVSSGCCSLLFLIIWKLVIQYKKLVGRKEKQENFHSSQKEEKTGVETEHM